MKQYEQFIGRKLSVEETVKTHKDHEHIICKVADGDPVIAEIKAVANAEGSKLRVFLPNERGTLDYDASRINVMVNKDKKTGDYVVKSFHIG